MDKREGSSPPAVGGSSLLVIFAVLCLTTFALLGLSTVRADGRLAQASADSVTAYYAADCRAEEIFAGLRLGRLPEETVTVALSEEGCLYAYACPISDTQRLEVELLEREGTWTVLRWQAVSTASWEQEDGLEVWDGDPIF